MKTHLKWTVLFVLVFSMVITSNAFSIGLEIAGSFWSQAPSGDVAYKSVTSIDLENDFNYDSEFMLSGRAKLDLPLIFPTIYVSATQVKYDATGQKSVSFKFGDQTFTAQDSFNSTLDLTHYDIAVLYAIPFLNAATLGRLNIEAGINVRVVDFKAQIDQPTTGISDSESKTFGIPTLYLGAAIKPIDAIALEIEGRGITYKDNHMYSLIGRLKYKVFGPAFCAVGYRLDKLKLDEYDIVADTTFAGPFAEIGLSF